MSAAQKSDLSVVGYWINSDPASRNFAQLERLGKGLTWEGQPSAGGSANGLAFLTNSTGPVDLSWAPGSLSAYSGSNGTPSIGTETGKFAHGADGDFHLLGDGVYRMEYGFLLKPFTDTGGVFHPARYSRGLEFTDDLFGSGIRDQVALNLELGRLLEPAEFVFWKQCPAAFKRLWRASGDAHAIPLAAHASGRRNADGMSVAARESSPWSPRKCAPEPDV